MGHLAGKDVFRRLGRKLDGLPGRAPWSETLHAILRRLYTAEEAELAARLPYGPARLDDLVRQTGLPAARLRGLLENLCAKGLVMDLHLGDGCYYLLSPMVIGIFEFTMMRTGAGAPPRELAALFRGYLEGDPRFFAANAGPGRDTAILRTLAHEESLAADEYLEILDFERASSLIAEADTFAVGLCACRHQQDHLGERECAIPLESCTSFGFAADYLVRRGLARTIDRAEMTDLLHRSRDLGLVLCADNVRRHLAYLCHCCGCCCTALRGISRLGYDNAVVTSGFLATLDGSRCSACNRCPGACPVGAIAAAGPASPGGRRAAAVLDRDRCLGCGVCALRCPTGALGLERRRRRVLTPEDTFEKILLQCLERGTLQNQLFADPGRWSHRLLRPLVGAFLRLPPVKRSLLSEQLRSIFLRTLAAGAARTGRSALADL